jgi:protein phosphatase-4 regulatory subunit 3
MRVIESNSKILQLQVIKFLKSVLLNNDENLLKIIVNNDMFAKIFQVFENNIKKDNMIVSGIMDIVEYLKKQNIKKIINYLVKYY